VDKVNIFTHARFLPSSKMLFAQVRHSILSEGSVINRSQMNHSIIGLRSRIGNNSLIDHSIILGADYFESPEKNVSNKKGGIPNIGIGDGCEIRNAILDNNVRIGNGVKLINLRHLAEEEADNYLVRDGITLIPLHSIIPCGTVL
jgi:glucose-1-phosphate adenylyltransferase